MPTSDTSKDRALRRLDKRLDALEAGRAPKPLFTVSDGGSASEGYRMLGQLLGGVLGGLGLGWLLDHVAHTSPWGVIGGLLIGAGLSTFAAVRTAVRLSARSSGDPAPASAPPDDEDDE